MGSCPVCSSPAAESVLLAPLPFLVCPRCELVFRVDRTSGAVHGAYEEGAYEQTYAGHYADPAELAARRRDARVRLRWLGEHVTAGRLLDVGAAGGAFVAEAGAAGFDARGVEPSPAFARFAREVLAVDVAQGTVESLTMPGRSLDVVTMWHVLEHLPDPLGAIRALRQMLVPGGMLAVEVPNFGSPLAGREGLAWGSLQPDVHVNQFGVTSLRALFERGGLEAIEVGTVPITPYLPRAARLNPRHLAARLKAARLLRSLRGAHPTGHELLRAVARRPAA